MNDNHKLGFRQFPDNSDNNELHEGMIPAEVYRTDPVSSMFSGSGTEGIKARVVRMSPFGAEFLIDSNRDQLKDGDPVDISITIGNQTTAFHGLTIRECNLKNRVGVRWCHESVPKNSSGDRRKSSRWICGVDYLPTGICPTPGKFNDFIFFRVRDLSVNGMQLVTSLRNKFLIPGMILDSQISFPMIAQIKTKLKILNCRISSLDSKDVLLVNCQIYPEPNEFLMTSMSEYLLQFDTGATVSDLRSNGFKITQASKALDFSFVKSANDYREVLELRRKAYSDVGKVDASFTAEQCGDLFDTRARILTARHHGKLVGSIRLMFHETTDVMEHEEHVSIPKNFPRKDEIVEVTRVCTDSTYRGSDILFAMVRHSVMVIAQSGRKYLMGSATPKLMPLYERMGFQGSGDFFNHAELANEKHELILANILDLAEGRGINARIWYEMYSRVLDFLIENRQIELTPSQNMRLQFLRVIGNTASTLAGSKSLKKR